MEYPKELLPRRSLSYPELNEGSLFVRTLKDFPAHCMEGRNFLPEITDEILKPNGNKEIYSLSLYLYGVYNKSHFGIIVKDKQYNDDWDNEEELYDIPFDVVERFGVFLKSIFLKDKTISCTCENAPKDIYHLHYNHKPTRSNYWHFELSVTKNDDPTPMPRKSGSVRNLVAEKIKEDILYFALDAAKEQFFSLYKEQIKNKS